MEIGIGQRITGNELMQQIPTHWRSWCQRVAWTDTWLDARQWFAKKLAELPAEHHYDAARKQLGNLARCFGEMSTYWLAGTWTPFLMGAGLMVRSIS
jgi:hypothetical protein